MPSELSIEMVRKAVQAKVFPMYEAEDGEKYNEEVDHYRDALRRVPILVARAGARAHGRANSSSVILNRYG
ncbi:MAG: hypothetical protein ABIJ61_01215 [bacterium]